ncbi:hypothetical protein [uncultured Muribaculum sp.]|uniref:hypothetical protein n=1 Tax=uncultured Muribaculum sp. TaxID=1918613 RepID=UPI00263BDF26|nr:hypothetical protein [uncultured Muribaculum sp.]
MDSVININRMMRRAQDAEPDWEQRRYEIAFAVYMERRKLLTSREDDVKDAVAEADLLIAELKKTQEKK